MFIYLCKKDNVLLKLCLFFCVVILDGREIRDLTRQFLMNWRASKEAVKNKNNKPAVSRPLIPHASTSESVSDVDCNFPMIISEYLTGI